MMSNIDPLVAIVTTDLSAITRGRSVTEERLETIVETGLGWVQANLSITLFNSIVSPNPWGSSGDIRLVPDRAARFRTSRTGSPTPFDMIAGDLVELDGTPWRGCTRALLKRALADLKAATGLSVVAAFEHEFQLVGEGLSSSHSFSLDAQRRVDPFGPTLIAALAEAGIDPEVMIAEFGDEQFEITHAPAGGLAAADRAVAVREITREVARNLGWCATFAPKTGPEAVGNGVHIHFSLVDEAGTPAAYDAAGPGGLSERAGHFCAGILKHLPAITALTASSLPSYYRLRPHSWSSSYTWLAERDREASLRICPTVSINGRKPEAQFNIEYRPADATANPYLALTAIVRAGLEGLKDKLPTPPLVSGDPTAMSDEERSRLGLARLPQDLSEALTAFETDMTVRGWLAPDIVETFLGLKRDEVARFASADPAEICSRYRTLY